MNGVRTALLIGVARADGAAAEFEPLDEPVEADLNGLRVALEESGYDVQVLQGAGRAEIGAQIFEVSQAVPDGGTLLVYFTGHGIRLDDTDYLVTADTRAPRNGDWLAPYKDSLQPADISGYLSECRAGTVLWFIDACRNGVSTDAAFGTRIVHGPPTGGFALMVGCDLGERCGYSAEGSFFAQGLTEAFSPLNAPRTVQEVYEAVRSRTSRLARKHGQTQRVQIRYGTDREEETRATQICDGRQLLDEWRAVVTDERLWQLVAPGHPGGEELVARLQYCLLTLVEDCARLVQHGQKRLPDPWADDDFAPRLLQRTLPHLVPSSSGLSAVEVAMLIAAVFLHEGAWADRLSQAAEANPLENDRIPGADAHRRHLEQVHDQHAHIARKLTDYLLKRRWDDCHDIALWLVHQWIAERFETDEHPVPMSLVTKFTQAILGQMGDDSGRVEELSETLSRLATSVGTDPPLDGTWNNSSRKLRLPEGRQHLRERPLLALLRMAGTLAVDVRVLPQVVAEHLGVSDAVTPKDVLTVAQGSLHWVSDGTALHMDVACPHQAVHAALEEVVDRADRLATQTGKLAEELPEAEACLLAGFPHRVTASDLRPQQVHDQKAYEVPLLRFRLAQTEVRDLLMGRQLYGSPELAIRELYQNAMDACRYRAMRWRYLRQKERHPVSWAGKISITQGADARGKYVECRDNGVGMGLEQLTNTFTRAGSRFEQSRLFRQEQASWLRHDPSLRLYPNSRFGIGVFSYFMLADEMTIVTRPVSRDGVPAQEALRVEISSSGSLFRILRHTEAGDNLAEGGTRVRLYLRDDTALLGLSCTKTLRSLVAVSEFQLEVRDSIERVDWKPGELYPLRAHESEELRMAVPGTLWWVDGNGAILCDGIATDKTPYGYVLNLTGTHAGTLSVNRKELQSYDHQWAEEKWREGAHALPGWPGLTMEWFWMLDTQNLPVARALWQELRGKGLQVPLNSSRSCDLDEVGILSSDDDTSRRERDWTTRQELQKYLGPWRAAVLERTFTAKAEASPISLVGHPVPEPGDAAICAKADRNWTKTVEQARAYSMTVGEVVRSLRRMRITHPALAPPPTDPGNLDWQPSHIDDLIVAELAGDGTKREMKGRDDLRGLTSASHRLHRPLGELAEICARYAPLRGSTNPSPPPHHRVHVCTDEDLAMLFIESGSGFSRRARPVEHPGDVREVSLLLDVEPELVLDRLTQFRWLGWEAPDADEVSKWMLPDEDVYMLLRKYTNSGQDLDWAATIVLAETWDLPLAEAEEHLGHWAETIGLTYPRRLDEKTDACDLIPSLATSLVVANAYNRGISLTQGFDLEKLALCRPDDIDLDEMPEVVDELREMNISVPDNVQLIIEWDDLPLRTRYAFSGNDPDLDQADYPTNPTTNVLFAASVEMKESLADVWKLARSEAVRFGISVPTLPKTLANFRPTWLEWRALLSTEDFDVEPMETPEWANLTSTELARYAYDLRINARVAYERLITLRPLGALIPEIANEALQALQKCTPDERDLVALSGEHRVSEPDAPLVALDLVSIAARLGEPIVQTWQRIRAYVPLGPAPEVSVFPDVIPCWQDLAILSRYLDGRLPAISGQVPLEHVAFVAGEVGETQNWVWERLCLYATMFELDLADMHLEEKTGKHD